MKKILIIYLLFTGSICCQNWFPAEVGNKTLEKCTLWEYLWGPVRNFFLISVEEDSIIDNQKYFLVRSSNYLKSIVYDEKWLRYDSDSNKIFRRVLDTSVVYMDFNVSADGQFLQYNPITGITKSAIVFESTIDLFGNTYSMKGFRFSEYSSIMIRKWIDGFGLKPIGWDDMDNPRIEQVLYYFNNDTVYLEYGYGPNLSSFSPILITNNFNFSFDLWGIDHPYSQNTGSIWVDFIDSVYFDCYYKSDIDSISADRIHSYKVYQPTPHRMIDFNIDSTLINSGYFFYYKVIVKDKGIIPKYAFSPDTGYNKLVFTLTGISDEKTSQKNFSLSQNYPNPFNPTTKIKFVIPKSSFVTLKVYDILGREVSALVNEEKQPGIYEVEFSVGRDSNPDLASGIYFYKLQTDNYTTTKKMIYLK